MMTLADIDDNLKHIVSSQCDLVLGVEHYDFNVRFDVLTPQMTYASRSYRTYPNDNCCGIYDILDDFYQKRIKFFNSDRTVQEFLLTLNTLEKRFQKTTGKTFAEYYAEINNYASEKINLLDKFNHPMLQQIYLQGYGISLECKEFYKTKLECIKKIGNNGIYVEDYASKILELPCVCVDISENNSPSFFIEPSIGMPVIFHYSEFATEYIDNLLIPYHKHNIFKNHKIAFCTIGQKIRMAELLALCGKDGITTMDEKIIFKVYQDVKTVEYTEDYIEGKMLGTVIAH